MRERVRRRRAAPRLLAKQGARRALHGPWVWRRLGTTAAQDAASALSL